MYRTSASGLAAFVVLTGIALLTFVGSIGISQAQAMGAKPAAPSAAVPAATPPASTADTLAGIHPPSSQPDSLSDEEVLKAMRLRVMGKMNAPVKIVEFASLSCPHCAAFFKDTFPQVQKKYIDTGKVQYTYVDFPLNAPALNAAAAALCMPPDSYFRFVDYLFQTQDQWAFSANLATVLVQNGKLLGADGDKLEKCISSQKLKAAIAERMQKESSLFGVAATPSFVFDNDKSTLVAGDLDFGAFSKIIDDRLAKATQGKAAK